MVGYDRLARMECLLVLNFKIQTAAHLAEKGNNQKYLLPRMCHTVAYCNILCIGRMSMAVFVSTEKCSAINYKYIVE